MGFWLGLAAAGAALPLGCAWGEAWISAPLAVAVLATCLRHCGDRPWRAAAAGWVFGSAWLLSSVWWLFISMHRYGGLPAPLAALAVLLLAMALSLYLAAAAAAWVRLQRGRVLPDAALLAALWTLAEWARAQLFTGFPWAASGYTQIDAPLSALAPLVGVHGIGSALALSGALLGLAAAAGLRREAVSAALAAAVLLGPALLPQAEFTRSAGRLSVSLLQPNVAQEQKFAAEHVQGHLQWLAQTMVAVPGQLVVAPETAVPLLPGALRELAPLWWETLDSGLRARGAAALVGLPLGGLGQGYTNSVQALGVADSGYRYDKHHLVPFGEFIPTGFRWFTQMMDIPLGDFDRGPLAAPSLEVAGQRIAPNICFEDLFGEELAARFGHSAQAPTVLVNLSNIGWFGPTLAVPQHLNISRMRALELERPMLRATNTGATAIVDHRGRVTAQLAAFTRGTLDGAFEGREGLTPFARWAGWLGLWPVFGLALLAAALCARPGAWPALRRDPGRDRESPSS